MMDVLIEPADQSRNAQSPEGLLPDYRPDLARASRRRDLAIGRNGGARKPCSLPLLLPGTCHAAASFGSKQVPSLSMRCMTTASLRASATLAFFMPALQATLA